MSALRIAVAGLATLTALPSAAAERGFYFGVQGGQADYEFAQPRLAFATIPIVGFFPPVTPAPVPPFIGGVANPGPVFVPVGSGTASQVGFGDPDADDSDIAWGATIGYRIFD